MSHEESKSYARFEPRQRTKRFSNALNPNIPTVLGELDDLYGSFEKFEKQ